MDTPAGGGNAAPAVGPVGGALVTIVYRELFVIGGPIPMSSQTHRVESSDGGLDGDGWLVTSPMQFIASTDGIGNLG